MDGAIDGNQGIIAWNAAKKKVATGTTASIGGAEVESIGMDIEDHVGGAVANFGIRMRGHVVEDLVDMFACLFSGGALLGGNG